MSISICKRIVCTDTYLNIYLYNVDQEIFAGINFRLFNIRLVQFSLLGTTDDN